MLTPVNRVPAMIAVGRTMPSSVYWLRTLPENRQKHIVRPRGRPYSVFLLSNRSGRALGHSVPEMLGISLKDDDLVFSTLEGKPLRPNTVSRARTIMAARSGLKVIRLHDAWHTHASLMLKQGVHPKIVQERLGHATIAVTLDTYSHVAPGLQEAAAAGFDKLVLPRLENESVKK
jgi:integrase